MLITGVAIAADVTVVIGPACSVGFNYSQACNSGYFSIVGIP